MDKGTKEKRIELGIDLYQKGDSLERAANISGAPLWDLIEEIKKRELTSRFDIEEEKGTIINILAKDDKELEKKIRNLKI
jgi:predicted HTH domain antitoxin